jgi:hypothetical protein
MRLDTPTDNDLTYKQTLDASVFSFVNDDTSAQVALGFR